LRTFVLFPTLLHSNKDTKKPESARHSYNEGRIKFGKKMYFELGSWEENRIFGRKGEKAKFETIFGKPW